MDVVGKALDEVFADSAVEEHSIKKLTAKGPESSKPGCCWGVTEMQSSIVLHHWYALLTFKLLSYYFTSCLFSDF